MFVPPRRSRDGMMLKSQSTRPLINQSPPMAPWSLVQSNTRSNRPRQNPSLPCSPLPSIMIRFRTTWLSKMAPLLLLMLAMASHANGQGHLPDAKRIVFLGDSITHAGGYIARIEAAMIAAHPETKIEILNVGLPSETVSGLSEPGHAGGQFPRPDLHERLERVLAQTKPDWVVACYGMNDGIYYPLSDDRFQKFRDGIARLHEAVEAHGAKILHLTPAYFDATPIKDRLLPAGRDEYRQPYEGYDDVLEAYSQWLLSKRQDGWLVLDVHGAMKRAVLERRKSEPAFTFASDGVHPNAAGQAVIAAPLASAWGLTLDAQGLPEHPQAAKLLELVSRKQEVLKLSWLSATRHTRPGIPEGLPVEQAQAKAQELDAEARRLASQR